MKPVDGLSNIKVLDSYKEKAEKIEAGEAVSSPLGTPVIARAPLLLQGTKASLSVGDELIVMSRKQADDYGFPVIAPVPNPTTASPRPPAGKQKAESSSAEASAESSSAEDNAQQQSSSEAASANQLPAPAKQAAKSKFPNSWKGEKHWRISRFYKPQAHRTAFQWAADQAHKIKVGD